MKKLVSVMLFFLFASICSAQNADLPSDFLSKDFHANRRQKLREKLPANSVAVLFANAVRNRANDVDYFFHQDPDFLYLTGYKEPNSVLLKSLTMAPNTTK
jgi:Xaa-Pro aminopeptidase